MTVLRSYTEGQWRTPSAEGTALHDAVTGEEVARVSSDGIDLAAALQHGRTVGGPALRELTFHQRAALLKSLGQLPAEERKSTGQAINAAKARLDQALEARRAELAEAALNERLDKNRLLSPERRETMLGNAEILEIFNISKVGKIAGCRVPDGTVERGANVRLIRDNVVIHEGKLATLKRFKDEVREVQVGQECGMAFENYDDIKVGDVIETFEMREKPRA